MRHLFVFFAVISFSNVLATEAIFQQQALKVGIISALPEEYGTLLEHMEGVQSQEKGMRTYYKGKLQGIDTVVVASRIGKVAAAVATTSLILDYNVDFVIFVGVAGAIDPSLNVGDIVVANALIQHDVDARPFCPIYEIPLLKIRSFDSDPCLKNLSIRASQNFIKADLNKLISADVLNEFHITTPQIYEGLVITGDQVISQDAQKTALRQNLPNALCVEMEGASVAQVCYEHGIPFVVIRTISDYANHEHNTVDVKQFIRQVSGCYSVGVINNLYRL